MPRWALLLFCATYLLPGIFGRAPWRSADITAIGVMDAMANGRIPWLQPSLGGVVLDAAPLPHWLGAMAIQVLPWLDASIAARVPFALLLAATMSLTWYAAFHLARTDAARPVAFAFGGEADLVAYARAVADGALLALIATLGLLLLGHETTPELAQLACTALLLWAMAAAPFRNARPRLALMASLPLLAASGAPMMALAMGTVATVIAMRSQYDNVRAVIPWIAGATLGAVIVGTVLGQWHWTYGKAFTPASLLTSARMLVWFLWPAWLLALWTLWRWRRQTLHRHIAVPLSIAIVAVVASMVMNGSQRALLLGLPAFAVLAAFALPTLKRSTGAAIDWFSMFLFSALAAFVWLVYASLQTGVPAWPLARVDRLYAGFKPSFSWPLLLLAVGGTVAWLGLVRWRTGRHRSAIWKSLVLPAGGVALSWLLVMTLLLPLADYVRSLTPWVGGIEQHAKTNQCIEAPGMAPAYVAALELHGRYRVDARAADPGAKRCPVMLLVSADGTPPPPSREWRVVAQVRRPSERQEVTYVLKRR